jgi:hypothetical protein
MKTEDSLNILNFSGTVLKKENTYGSETKICVLGMQNFLQTRL